MENRELISIIIPAYNEADTICEVVRSAAPYGNVIVVDDASNDGTGALASEAGSIVIRHPVNRGYDMAINSGFNIASNIGTDVFITLDGDGQHDSSLLSAFVEPLVRREVDMVLGIRPRMARWSEVIFSWYTNLKFGIRDPLCGMKGYRNELYESHGCFDASDSIGTELCLSSALKGASFKQVDIPIFKRNGKTRFGASIGTDFKILHPLFLLICGTYNS